MKIINAKINRIVFVIYLCGNTVACTETSLRVSSTPIYDKYYGQALNQSLETQKTRNGNIHNTNPVTFKEYKAVIDQLMTEKPSTETRISSPFQE